MKTTNIFKLAKVATIKAIICYLSALQAEVIIDGKYNQIATTVWRTICIIPAIIATIFTSVKVIQGMAYIAGLLNCIFRILKMCRLRIQKAVGRRHRNLLTIKL
jgi:hypothetical protein